MSSAAPCKTRCATTTSCSLEPYLDHPRELETSVMGNSRADTVAYGPGEVIPGREFYDYIAKYRSDESRTVAQADLDPGLAADIRAAAVEVYLAIGASGLRARGHAALRRTASPTSRRSTPSRASRPSASSRA